MHMTAAGPAGLIMKQILDEKLGLANGQPEIVIDDSLFFETSPLHRGTRVPRLVRNAFWKPERRLYVSQRNDCGSPAMRRLR